jgi:hypothetical protein
MIIDVDFLPDDERDTLLEGLRQDFPQVSEVQLVPLVIMAWAHRRCQSLEGKVAKKDSELSTEQEFLTEMLQFGFQMMSLLEMEDILDEEQRRDVSLWIGWEVKRGKMVRMK